MSADETKNGTQSGSAVAESSMHAKPLNDPLFGLRIIEEPHMVKRKMVRKPSFERYEWARRWVPFYRLLRAAYIRYVRRKWQQDGSNWQDVPMEQILKMPDGTLVMHPVMKARIKEVAREKR